MIIDPISLLFLLLATPSAPLFSVHAPPSSHPSYLILFLISSHDIYIPNILPMNKQTSHNYYLLFLYLN